MIKDTGMQIRTFCAPMNQPNQRTALPVHGVCRSTEQLDEAARILATLAEVPQRASA
jgi:hypothetical protein